MNAFEGKTFKHFKGDLYTFIGIARHSETNELLVIYRAQSGFIWARPYASFFNTVRLGDGTQAQRFELLDD